jgi:MinD-like ATPase involved in chromosome partitioning or flagellar assembly
MRQGQAIKREDVYPSPVVDGEGIKDTPWRRLRDRINRFLVSKGEQEEAEIEGLIRTQPGVSRPNTISVISPKGGVGKTTNTFLVGNLMATHLKLRVIAVDANPDFGTLAALAPDELRSDKTLAELMADWDRLQTAAAIRPYVSQLESGLHLLAAPRDPEVMDRLRPEMYGQLLAFLGQFYDVVLLDCGTGITDPLAKFAIERADQVVVITTPEWITAATVLGALDYLTHERTTVVLNKARRGAAEDREAIEQRFREQRLHRSVTIPYDERLQVMLDSGTYSLDRLGRDTRVPVKTLGLAVVEQLV